MHDIERPVIYSSGSIELLKWIGLALMTIDHLNTVLLGKLPYLYNVGRVAMPLFAFVLSYNLARPGAFDAGVYQRMTKNLMVYGLLATPFYILNMSVHNGWWPLNILFTFLIAVLVCYFTEKGGRVNEAIALALFAVGGVLVEYQHFPIAAVFLLWRYFRTGGTGYLALAILCLVTLYFANGNHWSCLALPIIFLMSKVEINLPRVKKLFYTYYPAHLAVIFLARLVFVDA